MSPSATSNDPRDRTERHSCSQCSRQAYVVEARRPDSDGVMQPRTAANHVDDDTPADSDCEAEPGPKAAALADWAAQRAQ